MTSIAEGRDLRPEGRPQPQPSVQEKSLWPETDSVGSEDLIIDKSTSSAFAHPHPAHSPRAGVSAAGSERLSLPGVSLTHSAFFSLSPLLFVDLTTSVFVSN